MECFVVQCFAVQCVAFQCSILEFVPLLFFVLHCVAAEFAAI